jgi:hypothetical protein
MKTVLVLVGVLVALAAAFVAWRLWATYTGERKAYLALAARIELVEQRLTKGQDPDPALVHRFARDRNTRRVLYDALEHHGRLRLFPAEFLTPEAIAEGDLVLWLAHPNELAATPDEIELMATLPVPADASGRQRYFLFRYRTHPPHWAAKDGWLAGVAGSYPVEGRVSPGASGTFSRFEPYASRTPEEHVRVIHELVVERR